MPLLPLFLRRLWLLRRTPVRLGSAQFLPSRTIVTATSRNLEISKVATISLVATLILGATSSRVDDMSRLRSIGDLNRKLLTPHFNTYKLASDPLFERTGQVKIPGGGTRATNRQLGGGFDFASTALRVNFNDLQPDRVFPQERFYLVSQDGHLLLLSLRDDPGEGDPSSSAETPLAIESLYHIQPPLQNGEIVSVCGCGETIVLCRHSGSIVILRSSPAPLCQTSVSGLLMLSQHGCSASQQDTSAFELEQVGARNRASQKDKLDATAAKADHSALEPGREEDAWTSAYYLLDARAGNGVAEGRDAEERASVQSELGEGSQASSQLTLLVAVVSRLGHAEAAETCGGRTRCRLQRIHLERSVASGPWQLISSVGVDVGAAVPPLARLWPSRDQILMASSQAYGDEELSDQGNPATRCEDDIAAQAAEYDDYETGYDRLVHLHMPVRSGQEGEVDACSGGGRRWKVRTYMLHDTAASSGPLTWIGLGGPESSAHGLPAVGLGAKTGLGMHDLHVMRVSAVLASAGGSGDGHTQGAGTGDAGPYALASEHVLTFPAVGYIQKGKTNKKGVTFSWSSAVPSAFILDAEDGLHAYESNTRGVLAGGQESTGGAGQTGGDVLQSARGESSFKTQKFVYGSAKLSTKARQSSIDVGQEACGGAAQGEEGGMLLGYQVVGRRVLILSRDAAVVLAPVASEVGEEDTSQEQDMPTKLPNGMEIPEHLLDDW